MPESWDSLPHGDFRIMAQILKILPLFTVLIAAPAFAAKPDPHAGHHPAAAAEAAKPAAPVANADAKPAPHACKMMEGKLMAGPGAMAGKGPDGKMMMDAKDMPCMPPPDTAKGADARHDHAHPDTAPK